MINKAQQTLADKQVNLMKDMQRSIREIKSRQPIGSDILSVVAAPSGSTPLIGGPFTINAGSSSTINITTVPASSVLTLWNFAFTVYVDVYDNAHQFPTGSSLTVASREAFIWNWLDWADSSDTTNSRVFKVRIRNSDPGGVTHNYYVAFKAYLPKATIT